LALSSPVRSLVAVAAGIILLAVTAWVLVQLAQRQFTSHLRDQAAHALALAAAGDTPYRWRLKSADDIVAGRVFGTDDSRFDNDELVVRSAGVPFEIGLPLVRTVDLRRFPHLQIAIAADAEAQLQVVAREELDAPELVTASTRLPSGERSLGIDLAAPGWTSQAHVVAAPVVAAMLRLRVALPAGKQLRLRTISLDRIQGAQPVDLARVPRVLDPDAGVGDATPVFRLPFRQPLQKVDIAALSATIDSRAPLLILLPQRGRVEQQIALRDAVFAALPGAILIPENAVDATFAQARAQAAAVGMALPEFLRWLALIGYALLLGIVRVRPPRAPRLRAMTEIALVLAAPLWLIVAGQFDGNPDAVQKTLIALSLIYAVSLSVPRPWRWNGSARAWLLAAALVVLAALLGFLLHRPGEALRAIGSGHVARYLAWALLQQYLICAVCTERWRIVSGNAAVAAYLGALGFALMHAPNAALMLATMLGGLCWCALYLRERALLPLAFSHAASALLLLALLPADILASAEVSARFFQ
jgi:hypothetical protein